MPDSHASHDRRVPDRQRLVALGQRLRSQAHTQFHRATLVLWGPQEWCRDCAVSVIEGFKPEDAIWLSQRPSLKLNHVQPLSYSDFRNVLGTERDGLILDLHEAFNPDALGAVTGIVRGGGLCICLVPTMEALASQVNVNAERLAILPHCVTEVTKGFLSRVLRILEANEQVIHLRVNDHDDPVVAEPAASSFEPFRTEGYRSDDQRIAVERIRKVAGGRSRRPLVLTADRGRGKSAAMGMAAGQLLRSGPQRIVVVAPSARSTAATFRLARKVLGHEEDGGFSIETEAGFIRFTAPAELVDDLPECDLLLVDEAAALPTELLKRLLLNYGRIVFSTTVHGYEGTGQGFGIRFRAILNRHCPDWRALQMHTPVRWAPGDPLEALTFSSLMLSAEPDVLEDHQEAEHPPLVVERISTRDLDNEALLSSLYGLLVSAHYRTTPTDLERLFDAPHLQVWIGREHEKVVGTALIAQEGSFGPELAAQINLGQRRPPGHLLPEALAVHCGLESAPALQAWRVVRIAAHPERRRQGVATEMLKGIEAMARSENVDYLGASFGATAPLVEFWSSVGFQSVRIGVKRGASSGLVSALVLKPISGPGKTLYEQGRSRFGNRFRLLLSEALRTLETDLVIELLRGTDDRIGFGGLSRSDWREVVSFAAGKTSFEASILGLTRFFETPVSSLLAACGEEQDELGLAVRKVLQSWSWVQIARELGLSGRKSAQQSLSRLVKRMVLQVDEPEVRKLLLCYGLV